VARVTALRQTGGWHKLVRVYLDGELALSLAPEAVRKAGLKVDGEVTGDELAELLKTASRERCREAALRYLSRRPRSQAELKERLARRGFSDEDISRVLQDLSERGLIGDAEFARFWQENRAAFSPRSRFLTGLELRRKGVASEVIRAALEGTSDEESAYQAALARARRLADSSYEDFRRRLGDYLRRRGFNYEVISKTVLRLWREMKMDDASSDAGP